VSRKIHTKPVNGLSSDWIAPPSIIKALGPFTFDPCAHPGQFYKTADIMISPPVDGLSLKWRGSVWLNPPYGSEIRKWLAKMALHGNGIALVHARTETRMFTKYVWPRAAAICFLEGRFHFHYPSGERSKLNSGAPVALIAYGSWNARALRQSRLGVVLSVPNDDPS